MVAAGFARLSGSVLRLKIVYAVSDRMKLLVGGEFYRGDRASQLGAARQFGRVCGGALSF